MAMNEQDVPWLRPMQPKPCPMLSASSWHALRCFLLCVGPARTAVSLPLDLIPLVISYGLNLGVPVKCWQASLTSSTSPVRCLAAADRHVWTGSDEGCLRVWSHAGEPHNYYHGHSGKVLLSTRPPCHLLRMPHALLEQSSLHPMVLLLQRVAIGASSAPIEQDRHWGALLCAEPILRPATMQQPRVAFFRPPSIPYFLVTRLSALLLVGPKLSHHSEGTGHGRAWGKTGQTHPTVFLQAKSIGEQTGMIHNKACQG